MKKIISLILTLALLCISLGALAGCSNDDAIIVQTNAYFAPFEYYDGTDIVGVDVEIMTLVGEKLGREVIWNDGFFEIIIDTVSEGKLADCGAAGITITPERADKVNFSTPYYTSIQYVIVKADFDIATKNADGKDYVVWEALAGMNIATQTDTTGWLYADFEVGDPDGVLYGTETNHQAMDSAQVAVDALGTQIDAVIVDELPAKYIVSNNTSLVCYPLYYSGAEGEADSPVEEQYAIAVNKDNEELLEAINEVLAELLVKDADGKTEIDKMVMQHMGMAE